MLKISKYISIVLLFVAILCNIKFAFAEDNSKVRGIERPISLTIAASNKDDDKLDHGIYIFRIHCASDSCSLERISMNECVNDKNGSLSFTPTVDSWVSWAGSLEANLNDNVLELDVFERTPHLSPAKMKLELDFSNAQSVQIKSFKATGFFNSKKWPGTDKVEYVPLTGDQTKQLNCPVFLPGITSEKK